jgi:hypothetical protein
MGFKKVTGLAALACASLSAATALATAVTWKQVSVPGGQITAITNDPVTPTTLYAGSQGGYVYVSTNSGVSWKGVKLPQAAGQVGSSVHWVLPLANKVVVASTDSGLSRSTNGGASFSLSKSYIAGGLPSELAAATGSKTVYAADRVKGLVVSKDAGLTWKVAEAGSFPAVAIPAGNANRIYAASASGSSGLFWSSTNGGSTWTKTKIPGGPASEIFIDPTNSATVYIVTGNTAPVSVSYDSGKTWTTGQFATTPDVGCGPYPFGIAVNPVNPNRVFMASDCGAPNGGVWVSSNKGKNWVQDSKNMQIGNAAGGVTIIPATGKTPQTIVAAGWGGVARSTDGVNFTYAVSGFNEGEANLVALDPSNDQNFFVAGHWGVSHSSNGGQTLTHVDVLGINGEAIAGLGIAPLSKGKDVYAVVAPLNGTAATLFSSVNGGTTWTSKKLPLGANEGQGQILFDPTLPNRFYLNGQMTDGTSTAYRSDNAGSSLTKLAIPTGQYQLSLVQNPTVSGTIFGILSGSIIKSTNAGSSFSTLLKSSNTSPAAISLAIGATAPQTVYVEEQSPTTEALSFASSTDGGKTWVAGTNPGGKIYQAALKADPGANRVFAISTQNSGPSTLYQTTDRGEHWTAVASPALAASELGFGFSWDITPSQIAIGTQNNGLFFSSLKGGPQPHDMNDR